MVRKSRKSDTRKRQRQRGGFLGDVFNNLTQTAKDAAIGIKNIATTAENKLKQGIGQAASGVKHLELKAEESAKQVATGVKQAATGVKQAATGVKQAATGKKYVANNGIQTINPMVGGKRRKTRRRTKRRRTKRRKTKRRRTRRKICHCNCKKC